MTDAYDTLALANSPLAYYKLADVPTVGTIWDSFDRPNNPTSLGTADSGQAWVLQPGWDFATGSPASTLGISLDTAKSTDASNQDVATIDWGTADGTFHVDVDTVSIVGSTGSGLIVRYGGTLSFWVVLIFKSGSNWFCYLRKMTGGGAFTDVSVVNLGTSLPSPTILLCTVSGSSWTVKVNGTTVITATDAYNSTATKHGIHTYGTSGARLNNYNLTYPPLADSSGNSRDGVYTVTGTGFDQGGPICSVSPNYAAHLNSTGVSDPTGDVDYGEYVTGLISGTGDFTVEGWMHLDAGGLSFAPVLCGQRQSSTAGTFQVGYSTAGHPFARCDSATFTSTLVLGREGCWNFLRMVRSSGTVTLLSKGVSAGSFASSGSGITLAEFDIGRDAENDPSPSLGHHPLVGSVARVAVYNTALDLADYLAKWALGCGRCGGMRWRTGAVVVC